MAKKKNLWIRKIWFTKILKGPVKNFVGFFRSVSILYLSSKNRVVVFYGWGHWWLSKKYADKRNRMDNRRYYVIPYASEDLIVMSSYDRKFLELKGLIRKGLTINELLKASYYYSCIVKKNKIK